MPSLRGASVYLTGATGFLGRYVLADLIKEGATVTALVRPRTDSAAVEKAGATVVRGDITDPSTLHLDGSDLVIHMAAWVGFGIPPRKREVFRRTNIDGTRNVFEAARKAGVRKAVHVSSVAALGDTGTGVANESTPRSSRPRSVYEETKVAAHAIAQEYGDLDMSIAMPGMVLGRGSDLDFLFRRFAQGELRWTVAGDGPTGWVHAEDVADGILLMASRGKGPYLLVDETLSVEELFQQLAAKTGIAPPRRRLPMAIVGAAAGAYETLRYLRGKPAPFGRELVAGMRATLRYDATRAKRDLEWKPDLFAHLVADVAAYRGTKADPPAPQMRTAN
ncbi:MAG: NAD-dependent epimerase/dehydratase family protein [Thermoplasmatota archaeon]